MKSKLSDENLKRLEIKSNERCISEIRRCGSIGAGRECLEYIALALQELVILQKIKLAQDNENT
jgi:hypothetical protein